MQIEESYRPRSEITASRLGSLGGLEELGKNEPSFKIKQLIIPQDRLAFPYLALLLRLLFVRKNPVSSSLNYSYLRGQEGYHMKKEAKVSQRSRKGSEIRATRLCKIRNS